MSSVSWQEFAVVSGEGLLVRAQVYGSRFAAKLLGETPNSPWMRPASPLSALENSYGGSRNARLFGEFLLREKDIISQLPQGRHGSSVSCTPTLTPAHAETYHCS